MDRICFRELLEFCLHNLICSDPPPSSRLARSAWTISIATERDTFNHFALTTRSALQLASGAVRTFKHGFPLGQHLVSPAAYQVVTRASRSPRLLLLARSGTEQDRVNCSFYYKVRRSTPLFPSILLTYVH